MAYDKERYENLIKGSKLFEIDKDSQNVAYRKEAMRMVEYLYCYLLAINEIKYEPFGCEIVEVAKRCINGFDGSGEFLHYFNSAWSREYSHILGNEIINDRLKGMKLTDQEKRNIKRYMRFVTKCNPGMNEEERIAKVSELMELPVEQVKQVAEIAETKIVSEVAQNSEGEEMSLYDQAVEEFSVENHFDNLASLTELLDRIESVYLGLQERQKPIVSDVLTSKIGVDIFEIDKLSKKYSFVSYGVCQQIKQTGKIPTQRDIADKYGKNEASISRTVKEFLKKIEQVDKEM